MASSPKQNTLTCAQARLPREVARPPRLWQSLEAMQPFLQQPALEPVLPALPHAARPGRASAPGALVHAVPAQSPRQPVSGSVSLGGGDRRANLCAARGRAPLAVNRKTASFST